MTHARSDMAGEKHNNPWKDWRWKPYADLLDMGGMLIPKVPRCRQMT